MEKVYSHPEFDIMWDADEEVFQLWPSEANDCPVVQPWDLTAAVTAMELFYDSWRDSQEF
jgi:hypothetical protein